MAPHPISPRHKSVHGVLGGGKCANLLLWRNEKASAGALCGITAIWILFDIMEYHFLSLVCNSLIIGLSILFLWSHFTSFTKISPPPIPEIPERTYLSLASLLRIKINLAIAYIRDSVLKDLFKFFSVLVMLSILSFVGSCCDFLTLLFIVTVVFLTLPLAYEKYEDQMNSFSEEAMTAIKKQYAKFHENVISKIPRGPLKRKD